ncbi:phosphate acetyltransferase [Fastidiosibacter lacustris]|uniref:phosphate acetyltransferase n=1 Tax=Fastidiosibacter lacustris TaxID=2056695 RepID=UPI000E35140D|nr:phosphate acetyltransferase [Fastidiosibacter lacustris]
MPLPIVLLPTGQSVGLFSLKQGLKHALEEQGYTVKLFNPLFDSNLSSVDIEQYFRQNRVKAFFEHLLNIYDQKSEGTDIILIDGIFIKEHNHNDFKWLNTFTSLFNSTLIHAFNADVVLIARQGNKNLLELEAQLEHYKQQIPSQSLVGAIITKLNAPIDKYGNNRFSLLDESLPSVMTNMITTANIKEMPIFKNHNLTLLGVTYWQDKLAFPRVIDIANWLGLSAVHENFDHNRRVQVVTMCSRTIDHVVDELKPGVLIITASDRSDIILATTLAAQKEIQISGLILTAFSLVNKNVIDFCLHTAQQTQLPIFATESKSISTILKLADIDYSSIPKDDTERLVLLKALIAEHIDIRKIEQRLQKGTVNKKMSPPAFRHYLIKRATEKQKRIVLPEGYEPRTIEAAIFCTKRKVAECILLGKREKILEIAQKHGLSFSDTLKTIDPDSIKEKYVAPLIEKRKHKGMTDVLARGSLEDTVTLGTMMLAIGDADGLVAGALNTTAHTISPALKIIKTKPECSIVSSVFFMCLEDQVLVYGDCAVNPDPNAQELAEIAIQSAESADAFGIDPKIAMISYSTGQSGYGVDVDKVRQATEIVKQKRPDLVIDGPLQYDAATTLSVACKKAPQSPVAGYATVLIFPDLNTGNTTYKAVQRSANVLSIGPILQGLNKPINDLSRGATVDDIIYTIAITAIQAGAHEKK